MTRERRAAAVLATLFLSSCGPMNGSPDPHRAPGAHGIPSVAPSGTAASSAPPRAASEPGRRTTSATSATSASELAPDAQILLDEHNRYRAKHCAKPLTWSPELAAFAQTWATTLRDKGCAFEHSDGSYGENLAAGTTGALDAKAVVAIWYDEIRDYTFQSPSFSMQTGHFTQVVWRGTERLGCARTTCKGMDIWVCEYDPPGNWQGRFREEVLPATCNAR